MKKLLLLNAALVAAIGAFAQSTDNQPKEYPGYKLVFHDEFDEDGQPDANYWTYDLGKRNNEDQLYTTKNAWVKDGNLVIEARKEDTQDGGKTYHYTSSSLATKAEATGDYISAWTYGRFEVRAKLPCQLGCWPAIWLLSKENLEWPYSGEIDMMEYYPSGGQEAIHANTCWGTTQRWNGKWNSAVKKISDLEAKNPNWKDEYHVWRMDWDKDFIKLYVDDELLNTTNLNNTVNPRAEYCWYDDYNPFRGHNMYLLVNLALGGNNGGSLANTQFPCQYLVDYVRIYQKDDGSTTPSDDTPSGPNLVTNGDFEDVSGVTFNHENGQPAAESLPGWDIVWNPWNVYMKIEEQTTDGNLIKEDNHQYISLNRYYWDGWGDGSIKQAVSVVPGHKYAFSYLYRFSYGSYNGDRPRTGFQVYDEKQDGDVLIKNEDLDPTGSWTLVKDEFTAVSDVAFIRIFLNSCKNWYKSDGVWAAIDEVKLIDLTVATGINNPGVAKPNQEATPYYNIAGQKIAKPQGKGIFIHNGKKYIVR